MDFENHFVEYDTIEFVIGAPDKFAWAKLRVQYQGLPIVNGRRIELGDEMRFIVPGTPSDGCCGPYLSDLKDIVLVSDE